MPLVVAADETGRTRVVFIRNVFAFVPVANRAAELIIMFAPSSSPMTGARNTRHLPAVSLPDVLDDSQQETRSLPIRHTSDRGQVRVQKRPRLSLGARAGRVCFPEGNCRYMTTGIGTVALPPGRVTAASQAPQRLADECAALVPSTRCDVIGAFRQGAGSWSTLRPLPSSPYSRTMTEFRGDRHCA